MRLCATEGCVESIEHRDIQTRFCSPRCAVRSRRGQASYPRACPCGVDISLKPLRSKFCSPQCKEQSRPDRSEYKRAKTAEWRTDNPGRNESNAARWRKENRDKYLEGMASWQRENPDKVRLYQNRRRAQERANECFAFTERDWLKLVARFNRRCAYCDLRCDDLQLEHVIPVSRGGSHGAGNILPACPQCNRSKKAHLLSEWRHKTERGV